MKKVKTFIISNVAIAIGVQVFFRFFSLGFLLSLFGLLQEFGRFLSALFFVDYFHSFKINHVLSVTLFSAGDASLRTRGIIALGGFVLPLFCSFALFIFSRDLFYSKAALFVFGLFFTLAAFFFAGNLFCFILTLLLGGFFLISCRGPELFIEVLILFFAVHLSLGIFSKSNHLFCRSIGSGCQMIPSDMYLIAEAFGLTYWAWSLFFIFASLGVLIFGFNLRK